MAVARDQPVGPLEWQPGRPARIWQPFGERVQPGAAAADPAVRLDHLEGVSCRALRERQNRKPAPAIPGADQRRAPASKTSTAVVVKDRPGRGIQSPAKAIRRAAVAVSIISQERETFAGQRQAPWTMPSKRRQTTATPSSASRSA